MSARRLPDKQAIFADVAYIISDLYAGQTAGKTCSAIESRRDDHLSRLIDKAPFTLDPNAGESFRESGAVIKLRRDYPCAGFVDEAPLAPALRSC